jgi:putative flippase GtrA
MNNLQAKYLDPRFLRYLLVGAANTVIGYSLFAVLTYLLTDKVPHAYMAACILGNVIAISVAYVNYKFFVFKTRGNYLAEYLRFYVVYGFSFILGLVLLPLFVEILGINPYLAGALLTTITVICSFLGHKNYSFQSSQT